MARPFLVVVVTVVTTLTAGGAMAQTFNETAFLNAQKDRARAVERQARSIEHLERMDRDRARSQDRARHNAEVTSRSSRRFD